MMNTKDSNHEKQQEVDPSMIQISRNERGQLVYRRDKNTSPVENVRLSKCFPRSLRNQYISIRDSEGQEVCLVRTMDDFSPATRRVVEEEFRCQEFIPQITSIDSIVEEFDVMIWKIQTDCGPIEIQVKDPDDVRRLDNGTILIKDYAGSIFEIADVTRLDPKSRRILDQRLF